MALSFFIVTSYKETHIRFGSWIFFVVEFVDQIDYLHKVELNILYANNLLFIVIQDSINCFLQFHILAGLENIPW